MTLQAKAQAEQELQAQLATTQQHVAELQLLKQESADCQAEVTKLQQQCDEALRFELDLQEKASALQQQKTAIDADLVAVVDATEKASLGTSRVDAPSTNHITVACSSFAGAYICTVQSFTSTKRLSTSVGSRPR
jgi:hypothetical protein